MSQPVDFVGQPLEVGDTVVCTASYGRSKALNKCVITEISASGRMCDVDGLYGRKHCNNVVKVPNASNS